MSAPDQVLELIERFTNNRGSYRSDQYNEARLRIEFLNPFFEALGWDVNNRHGYAEAYKDVIYEDAIKVGSSSYAPDYCFRIGGARKFFVEAKKPAVNIKDATEPAFQLRRYAWSAKLPLSILTDFEEFAIYDCRIQPDKNDRAAKARIEYFPYTDYAKRWEEIASIFSREAVLKGSFDRYAEASKDRHGTAEVDDAFLKDIEDWRALLAMHLARRNKTLTQRELNYAVQMTIDRIIFLRICEDRGIEEYERLKALLKGSNVYERLCVLFQEADARYNSGLFHFGQEKDQPDPPDELTLHLTLDDQPLKGIIKRLYYPESPYEFSALPADVLGQVYEQFLGKVIHLNLNHQVTIEEKPAVRKAGGVYYTPTFVVDCIVRKTLGKLLEGKKPGPRGGASKLRIVDPACGSGSFLIAAYQYLLDWHRDRYVEDGPQKHKELYEGPGGQWLLTPQEKKRILLNNIFGVDIDTQAVEVTKLSLLLKVLEGESQQTIISQLRLFQERALPDLDRNIKCGNSLIGPDFFKGQSLPLFDEEEHYRINAFDWAGAFPAVFSGDDPGFDAVIGNPPYIRIQALKEWAPIEVEYYKQAYQAASKGNYDIYVVFVERALSLLLNSKGHLGFILPHKFFNAQYGEPLRGLLARGRCVSEIVHFGHQQVFEQATTYTCLLFLDRAGSKRIRVVKVDDLPTWRNMSQAPEGFFSADALTEDEWNFSIGDDSAVFVKLGKWATKLSDVARIFQGLVTGSDKVFVLELVSQSNSGYCTLRDRSGQLFNLEQGILRPFINDITVATYEKPSYHHRIIFPYQRVAGDRLQLIPVDTLSSQFPNAWSYLQSKGDVLRAREGGSWNHAQWYAFGRTQNLAQMDDPKLIVQVISKTGKYAYDADGIYFTGGGNGPYYGVRWAEAHNPHSLHYLQALLTSNLLDTYLHSISSPFRGGYWSYGKRFIEQLPVRTIDFSDPADKARHDRIVSLVQQMLALHRRQAEVRMPQDKNMVEQQIRLVEQQIDREVYQLYSLTAKEIELIERHGRVEPAAGGLDGGS